MPPRPFPFHISIGTDIQHVPRIRLLLTKVAPADRHAQLNRFLRRFLAHIEQKHFWTRFAPLRPDGTGRRTPDVQSMDWDMVSKHLSGRWAAKEAVIKAFTWRRLSPLNVLILSASNADVRGQGPLYALVTDKACASYDTPATRAKRSADLVASDVPRGSVQTDDNSGSEQAALQEDDIDAGPISGEGYMLPHEQHLGMDGQIAKISISHDGDYATAVCLAAEEPMAGDVGGEMHARAFHGL